MEKTNEDTFTDVVLATLIANPKATIGDIAKAAYGNGSLRSRMRVSGCLQNLVDQKRIKRVGRGRYKAITEKGASHV